jgi:hypothetical protein
MPAYNVFIRTWWRKNPNWPNGLEPHPGRKRTIRRGVAWAEARQLCDEYNESHRPGRYSRKAEFEEA